MENILSTINSACAVGGGLHTLLCEAVNACFEAKHGMIGNILSRAAHLMSEQNDIPYERAKEFVLELQHRTMDMFAPEKGVKKEVQPEFKEKMSKYFPAIIRLIIDDCDFTGHRDRFTRNMLEKFYTALEYMLRSGEATSDLLDPDTGKPMDMGDIISKYYGLAMEERKQHETPVEPTKRSDETVAKFGDYSVVYIPDFETAQEYSDVTGWCICRENRYWDDYSDDGQNKCYFVLRNGYDSISPSSTPSSEDNIPWGDAGDEDDLYGRSMVGLFVSPEGNISSLFNRRNKTSRIYDEEFLSRLLGVGFSQVFCPYTEDELATRVPTNDDLDYINQYIANYRYDHPGCTLDEVKRYAFNYLSPGCRTEPMCDGNLMVFAKSEDGYGVPWGDDEDDDFGDSKDEVLYYAYDFATGALIIDDGLSEVRQRGDRLECTRPNGTKNVYDTVRHRWLSGLWYSGIERGENATIVHSHNRYRFADKDTMRGKSPWHRNIQNYGDVSFVTTIGGKRFVVDNSTGNPVSDDTADDIIPCDTGWVYLDKKKPTQVKLVKKDGSSEMMDVADACEKVTLSGFKLGGRRFWREELDNGLVLCGWRNTYYWVQDNEGNVVVPGYDHINRGNGTYGFWCNNRTREGRQIGVADALYANNGCPILPGKLVALLGYNGATSHVAISPRDDEHTVVFADISDGTILGKTEIQESTDLVDVEVARLDMLQSHGVEWVIIAPINGYKYARIYWPDGTQVTDVPFNMRRTDEPGVFAAYTPDDARDRRIMWDESGRKLLVEDPDTGELTAL